ncbi:MAG: DHHA1 domain-containing protein [Candidatus Geothermarchaeales archaeon]
MKKKEVLLEKAREVAESINEHRWGSIAVLTHYDADGLAAGGAFVRLLTKLNLPFVCRSVQSLTEREMAEFLRIRADLRVLLDFGTGQFDMIMSLWERGNDLLIIDHHQPHGNISLEEGGALILNPELHGLDGGREGCTALLASLVAYHGLEEKDDYMLKLGVVGAVGDMQDMGEAEGFNDYFFAKAGGKNVVKSVREFTYFRLRYAPIHKAISWTYVPYIPGLSGREDVAVSVLTSANIPLKEGEKWRNVRELKDEEKKRIIEEIIKYAASLGVEVKSQDLLQTIFEFSDEDEVVLSNANEFSHTLSTCGRMDRTDLGLMIAAGVRGEAIPEVRRIIDEKRSMVASQIGRLNEGLTLTERVLLVDGRGVMGDRFTGTFATYYSHSPLYKNRVVIAYCDTSGDKVKLSARAPREFVDRGFNLGKIIAEVASRNGGVGGGHNVAAGATLPREKLADALDGIVKRVSEEMEKVAGEG